MFDLDRPGTRLHTIWKGIKRRCQSPAAADYRSYGGRGISLCAEWQTFVGFLDWALTSGYANDKDIDRVDNDGPYRPENCRWIGKSLNSSRRALQDPNHGARFLTGALTDEQIADAQPEEHPYKLWDSNGSGLHLAINRGGSKSWRVKYLFDGREQLLTLGRWPDISLIEAREWASIAQSRIRQGVNPAAVKKASIARRNRRKSMPA